MTQNNLLIISLSFFLKRHPGCVCLQRSVRSRNWEKDKENQRLLDEQITGMFRMIIPSYEELETKWHVRKRNKNCHFCSDFVGCRFKPAITNPSNKFGT